MSLRVRFTLLVAAAVAIAVAAVAIAAFASASRELESETDAFLLDRAAPIAEISSPDISDQILGNRPRRGSIGALVAADSVLQLISPDGSQLLRWDEDYLLPVEDKDLTIALRGGREVIRTVSVEGERYRMITAPLRGGGAVQIGRSLEENDAILAGLGLRLMGVGAIGVALAAFAGWAVAGRALVPIGALTNAAERVASTQDLDHAIHVEADDEVGRLAGSFNTMLEALASSRRQQQQLVNDASHELRTPLTSLRTNIELLAKSGDMEPGQRAELLSDVKFELEELSALAAELVELATDSRVSEEPFRTFQLDELAESVAERYRRRSDRPIAVSATPNDVQARSGQIDRAVSNLVDNALKWGPTDRAVEITVAEGLVEVRDHGPGIPDEDLPFVFDRFYRSAQGRALPGSGLGLSIVKQIVNDHGGKAWARNAPDGGAIVGFEIPAR